MSERNVIHTTFVTEHSYDAPPRHVFAAFADPEAKARWFASGEAWGVTHYELDFRVGGRERCDFRPNGSPAMSNDTVFHDIVPNKRIVLAYSMASEGKPFSASLATIELLPAGSGTRLIYTEQAAFLDGAETPAQREAGCRWLLEELDKELQRTPAAA
jgi:uncharacterized protein YndB with AHSA1/START domain